MHARDSLTPPSFISPSMLIVPIFLLFSLVSQSTSQAFDEKASAEEQTQRDKTIQTMTAAYEAATAPRKPYQVHAKYESHKGVDGETVQTYGIEFDATFSGDQFRYDFEFEALPPSNKKPYDRIIAMSDGESVYVSRFTPRINPTGCEADIYPCGTGIILVATRSLRFAYHDTKSFLIPPSIFDSFEIETTETESGDLECTYTLDDVNGVRFVLSKKQAFNLVSAQLFHNDSDQVRQEQLLKWKQLDGRWYLSDYRDSIYDADGSLKNSKHLEITDFKMAAAANLKKTAMSVEEMAVKGRVLDRRRDGDEKIFEFVTKGLADESRKE